MVRLLTFLASACCAVLIGWVVPLAQLFGAFSPLTTALSIMVAAVFVRLNRGMPSLEWKSVEPARRAALTGLILRVARDYLAVIALNSLALVAIVILVSVGKDTIQQKWTQPDQHAVATTLGALLGLCFARMVYVVWRDYDIMRLQKELIDAAAANEDKALQAEAASDKVARLRSAGFRTLPVEVKEWGN